MSPLRDTRAHCMRILWCPSVIRQGKLELLLAASVLHGFADQRLPGVQSGRSRMHHELIIQLAIQLRAREILHLDYVSSFGLLFRSFVVADV